MHVYADSSFLVSCYLVDANTTQAKAYRSVNNAPLAFTTSHELDVRNALQLGVFRGRTQTRHDRIRRMSPSQMAAAVPTQLRQQIDRWANAWIKQKFGRGLELRAADPGPYNYPVEVFSEWRGKAFYICAKYRAKSRRPEDDFVVRSARMTLKGFARFDLAYLRHTERWFTVYRALTATECLEEIEGNEVFWPM